MLLDLDTLYFSSAASRAAYFVVFLVVALRRPRELHLWHWLGAIIASMIGSTVMMEATTTQWLTPLEALLAYTFYAASLILSWSGLRLFNGRSTDPRALAFMTLLPGSGYMAALALGVPMRIALAGVILLCAAYALAGTCEAVRRPAPERRLWSAYIISATLGSYAVMLLFTFAMLVGTDLPMNSPESGMISIIADQASGILIYFGYIAMAKEQAVLAIERYAETDPLTGLRNRRGLQAALGRLGKKPPAAARSGILMMDIDHFKSINDTHGHAAGDAVLAAFSQRLQAMLRRHDIAARWGGEEFIAILPDTDARTLETVAERLRSETEAHPFTLPDGHSIGVTVSIGINPMAPDDAQFEALVRRADAALYEAKHRGRNRVCMAPPPFPSPVLRDCPA